jgi:hypothetical protein
MLELFSCYSDFCHTSRFCVINRVVAVRCFGSSAVRHDSSCLLGQRILMLTNLLASFVKFDVFVYYREDNEQRS